MAIHIALTLSLAGSLALALLLLTWADRVAGARLLVVFLCGVCVWIVGNELPTWLGPDAERPALMLLATASVTSATFFHFALVFSGASAKPAVVATIYGFGLAATLLSIATPPGDFKPFAGVALMAMPNATGWVTSLVWAVLAAGGQALLLRALWRQRGLARRQIAAVTASSAWGMICMSGYGIAALRLPIYPWPLLLLPAYPIILVYGILRYRVFVANAWARRALVWTMLTAIALLVVALTPLLPLEGVFGRLASGALTAALCLALSGPARHLAEFLVYPGGTVSPEDVAAWRQSFSCADTQMQLAERAAIILKQRLGVEVRVAIGADTASDFTHPSLLCHRTEHGWQTRFFGWDAAPPGARHLATLFGAILAEEIFRMERAAIAAERERVFQTQARLAELGQLAASVAHDIRNPLNIIAMAAATAAPETRAEIREQINRISDLSRDLLDYAKPWKADVVKLDVSEHVRGVIKRFPGVTLGFGLHEPAYLTADPQKLDRALTNLLENACATGGEVGIEAEIFAEKLCLHVYDTGPGIPESLRDRIFEPFVSRGTGGTGLGLAIVARIMQAHGGTASLTVREGWTTCVTLTFPQKSPA
jgi:signal transduction histidine kinase